jgi:hypothetical protein
VLALEKILLAGLDRTQTGLVLDEIIRKLSILNQDAPNILSCRIFTPANW